ncbi:hypothetical protein SK128_010111 [Halocaridina rubra]|uniref:Uncharacterized protein n=1 Tax=Halocaridina rubra TaxID=373956 RepID=A0AAN9A7C2_HALRR
MIWVNNSSTHGFLSQERTRSTDIATELRRSDGGDSGSALVEGLIHETSLTSLAPSPSKHDKKVTFAKLLDKMSKEISSSSSDISCAEDKSPSRPSYQWHRPCSGGRQPVQAPTPHCGVQTQQ